MGVTLGVAVQKLAEERSSRPIQLRDEDERLANGDDMRELRGAEDVVLLFPSAQAGAWPPRFGVSRL